MEGGGYHRRPFPPTTFTLMAKVCQITGVGVTRGHHIHRSGKAKKEGGIGRHITKRVKRVILPNLRKKRIWVPELGKFVDVKLTARALKTVNKNGALKTLKAAGLV
jgi:large subunit ribosomal protein L28